MNVQIFCLFRKDFKTYLQDLGGGIYKPVAKRLTEELSLFCRFKYSVPVISGIGAPNRLHARRTLKPIAQKTTKAWKIEQNKSNSCMFIVHCILILFVKIAINSDNIKAIYHYALVKKLCEMSSFYR